MGAAGGIISSASDMAFWLRVQLRKGALAGKGELFSSTQSRQMWQPHTPIPVSDVYRKKYPTTHFRSYGLGWSLSDYAGRKIVGHGGGYDGMYSQVVLVPEENLGMVVLTNSMTSISPVVTYKILDSYLKGTAENRSQTLLKSFINGRKEFQERIEDVMKPLASGTSPSHAQVAYTGRFECEMYGSATVEIENRKLVLKLLPNKDLVADLTHLHYDTYALNWRKEFAWFGGGTAHFVANSKGQFHKLELDVPNDDLWFYELDFQRVELAK